MEGEISAEEPQFDKVSQASMNGIYVKAQELDRGHNVQAAPKVLPAGAPQDHQSHASTHASTHSSDDASTGASPHAPEDGETGASRQSDVDSFAKDDADASTGASARVQDSGERG